MMFRNTVTGHADCHNCRSTVTQHCMQVPSGCKLLEITSPTSTRTCNADQQDTHQYQTGMSIAAILATGGTEHARGCSPSCTMVLLLGQWYQPGAMRRPPHARLSVITSAGKGIVKQVTAAPPAQAAVQRQALDVHHAAARGPGSGLGPSISAGVAHAAAGGGLGHRNLVSLSEVLSGPHPKRALRRCTHTCRCIGVSQAAAAQIANLRCGDPSHSKSRLCCWCQFVCGSDCHWCSSAIAALTSPCRSSQLSDRRLAADGSQ
jgi:hypothetical protein